MDGDSSRIPRAWRGGIGLTVSRLARMVININGIVFKKQMISRAMRPMILCVRHLLGSFCRFFQSWIRG
jgi:hypothetical protein